MRRLFFVLAICLLGAAAAHAQTSRRVDLRTADGAEVQQIVLTNGSRMYGRVEAVRDDAIAFTTADGNSLTILKEQIAELRVVHGRIVDGVFHFDDAHGSRLFGGPTARSLRRGQGYVSFHQVIIPSLQIGVTDRFSIGAATPVLFPFDDHPVAFTPKLQLMARERVQVAAGTIHLLNVDDNNVGIGYLVTTLGSLDKALTVGLGYGYDRTEGQPVLLIGGEIREGRRVKWFTENWIWGTDAGFLTGGARIFGERFALDLGLVAPLGLDGYLAPIISLSWAF
jgi:hypothetical protein